MHIRISVALAALLLFVSGTAADEGLRSHRPDTYALMQGSVVTRPGQLLENATIIVRDGRIVDVGVGVAVPAGARRVDMSGKTLYAGFIDAYSTLKMPLEAAAKLGPAPHKNSLITPQRRVADHFKTDRTLHKKLRSQGFVLRLVAPADGTLQGASAVVTTGETTSFVLEHAAQHLRLTVKRGREHYPNSPMGAVAIARQAFYDAQWLEQARAAFTADPRLAEPQRNTALEAIAAATAQKQLFIADGLNELYALRADRFAREFSLNLAIRGSGKEYRRLDAVRRTGRSVIAPVNFPAPPDVGSPESALNASLEDLMHWDIAPENPARLVGAGIDISLTTYGLKDPAKFLAQLRVAVQRGLAPVDALRALTTAPAKLLGISDAGEIARGKAAHFVVADGDIFQNKTTVLETWVAGQRFEHKPAPRHRLAGKWKIVIQGQAAAMMATLKSEDGGFKGEIGATPSKKNKAPVIKQLAHTGQRGDRLSFSFDAAAAGKTGVAQISAVILPGKGVDDTPSWDGVITWKDLTTSRITATQVPAAAAPARKAETAKSSDSGKKVKAASFPVNYPLGAFGSASQTVTQQDVLFRNATVWTCADAGVLKHADVLVSGGKIAATGKNLQAPAGAKVIDATDMHLSPGIIDCHSHMATDGGVNESGQAVTAEVRIGDFIDCDDITIYRQLAGGVTTSNILHGSANPIGGQNQVIKLRWGAIDEAMKFKHAPGGIKFALGENVKQSNWGEDHTTRYPQTRMGVEQIMRDELEAARRYSAQWAAWRQKGEGPPPRRDLELDAVAEILQHKRWIHCHSYRQDEILTLIRTLDKYKVTIGTFQHILEGYKVASEMKKHGAMGSSFSDWWAYKFEVFDAIPHNGALMHKAGVVVSFNSDDRELGSHLNQEAAKAVKYGGVAAEEALKFVTLNPARQLRIEKYTGSIEAGKDADLALWSGPPLSNFSRCEQTWIDGRRYFDRQTDAALRLKNQQMRATLIQKVLRSGEAFRGENEIDDDPSNLWPREDTFCHGHSHGHNH